MPSTPKSMTGFAAVEDAGSDGTLRLELRAVNHRFLELSCKLPEELRSIEPLLRERVAKRVQRGKLDATLRWRAAAGGSEPALDERVAGGLLGALAELRRSHPDLRPPSVGELLQWPGLLRVPEIDGATLAERAGKLIDRALAEFEASREREGAKLTEAIHSRRELLLQLAAQARELGPEIRAAQQEKLRQRYAEAGIAADGTRFEQELVMALSKLDVDEELDRLATHLDELKRVLGRNEPVGRRLDFLVQELHREANTFGAKSIDARTSQLSIDLKVAIEQIREQVQNLE